MLIALDIGNTHIRIGGFDEDVLRFTAAVATDERLTGEQYACLLKEVFALHAVQMTHISGAVLCCVVPAMLPIMRQAIRLLSDCRMLALSAGVKTGLNIRIDYPRLLGNDLAATAVYAAHTCEMPCIIVDLGTATTFTALDRNGVLIGTAIAPGIRVSLEGLAAQAAQLPLVGLEAPDSLLGKNTADAMKSGIAYGTAAMVDGMVERISQTVGGEASVLLTGGASAVLAPLLRTTVRQEENATLRGLSIIWQKNQPLA